jgi:hypothetical protein
MGAAANSGIQATSADGRAWYFATPGAIMRNIVGMKP